MVIVIVHHTVKDYNAFCSRAVDWIATLKPEKGYKYIRTYNALVSNSNSLQYIFPKQNVV